MTATATTAEGQGQGQRQRKNENDNNERNDNGNGNDSKEASLMNILPKIFSLLPFDSLLTARAVSRTWNAAICSHPLFARRCVVTVRHSVDDALALFVAGCQRPRPPPSTSTSTLSSFRFVTKSMNNSSSPQIEFWERFGPSISHLDLSTHSLGPVSFLEVLLACPNLKELCFDCAPICATSNQHATASVIGPDGQVQDFVGAPPSFEYQKLIPNSPFVQESGLLHKLEVLHVSNSNFLPPGVLSDLLLWGGGIARARTQRPLLRSLSIVDDFPGVPFVIRGVGAQTQVRAAAVLNDSKPPIPGWDPRHAVYVVQKQAPTLTVLELCGFQILPEHIYALSKIKGLQLRVLKLRAVQADTPSLIALFRRQKSLEELDLSYANGVSDKAFLHPSCTFFHLHKLSLAGYTSHLDFLGFLSRMGSSLVELNLSSSRSNSMTWDNLIHSFLPIKLRRLTRLDLSYSVALGSLKRPSLFQGFMRSLRSTLTCLNLSCNTAIKNNFLQVIWHELWALRILYLETLPGVTDEGFTGIRQSQFYGIDDSATTPATSVGGSGAHSVHSSSTSSQSQNSRIIDYLNSSGVLRRHNNGAGHIGYCASIQTLSLANNQKLTDFVAQYGVRFLANLQKLKLAGCPKLTDRCIFYLIGSCPKLEYLDLRGCPRITQEWIRWAESAAASPNLKILLDTVPPKPVAATNLGRGVTIAVAADKERPEPQDKQRQSQSGRSQRQRLRFQPLEERERESQDQGKSESQSQAAEAVLVPGQKELTLKGKGPNAPTRASYSYAGERKGQGLSVEDKGGADADVDTDTQTDTDGDGHGGANANYTDDEATATATGTDTDTDTDASTDANSDEIRIIMPRKVRRKMQPPLLTATPPSTSASSSRSRSLVAGAGSGRGPFKITVEDANNNKLKIPN